MIKNLLSDDRGVSQVMGYAMIFGLVIITMTATLNLAQPMIDDRQAQQSALTATHQFDTINNYINKIEHGANQRFVRVELPAGQLHTLEPTTIQITSNSNTSTIETEPLLYSYESGSQSVILDGRVVAYKAGQFDTSSAQLHSVPRSTYMENNYVFAVPNISYPDRGVSEASTRTMTKTFLINRTQRGNLEENPTETLNETTTQTFGADDSTELNISVTTNNPSLWVKYLERHPATHFETTPDYTPGERTTITAKVNLSEDETFTVTNYNISIRTLN